MQFTDTATQGKQGLDRMHARTVCVINDVILEECSEGNVERVRNRNLESKRDLV